MKLWHLLPLYPTSSCWYVCPQCWRPCLLPISQFPLSALPLMSIQICHSPILLFNTSGSILLLLTFSLSLHLSFFWTLLPIVFLYIYYLLLLSWTPIQTPLLSCFLALLSSILPYSSFYHFILLIFLLNLLKTLLLLHNSKVLFLNLPSHFSSIYLPILPTHIIIPTVSAPLLLHPLFSS